MFVQTLLETLLKVCPDDGSQLFSPVFVNVLKALLEQQVVGDRVYCCLLSLLTRTNSHAIDCLVDSHRHVYQLIGLNVCWKYFVLNILLLLLFFFYPWYSVPKGASKLTKTKSSWNDRQSGWS